MDTKPRRRVLLLEPDYKNKYPPIGLMKIATYYRQRGDDVRFFKGDLKLFAAQLLCEKFLNRNGLVVGGKDYSRLVDFIRVGQLSSLDAITSLKTSDLIPQFKIIDYDADIRNFRARFKEKRFPQFDIVCVTTLFTFYWKQTVETIKYAKNFCADGRLIVGGIAATILPEQMRHDVGEDLEIVQGLLDKPCLLDDDDPTIIDELPPDYSILDEIDYKYPSSDAYISYTTRGCPNHCAFCVVPTLEPEYKHYISIKDKIEYIDEHFGAKKDLLLMDNNVFASNSFEKIIDEIKDCGFARGASHVAPNEYDIAIKNLRAHYNDRAYIRKMIQIYDRATTRLSESMQADFYIQREERGLLYQETATAASIIDFDEIARPICNKLFANKKRARYIDFNQGLDARLATDAIIKKLAEVNIRPLRIAFDHYEQRETYAKAIRLAAEHGIKNMSNYLLFNFLDRPEDLYYRMELNVNFCEELGVNIYSFPMKYHPIADPKYFSNRDFIGEHWNRKFLRAVQAVLNATKGKIGRGKKFFQAAFGRNIEEFFDILWMPEAFIIQRYDHRDDGSTQEWRDKFNALAPEQLARAKAIISENNFSDAIVDACDDLEVRELLRYYQIRKNY